LGIGIAAIVLLLFKNFLVAPPSIWLALLALGAVVVGHLIHYFLFYVFSIIAFWMDQTWGLRFVIRVIMEIATGAIIPLSLFPGIWKTILDILPFKYLIYVPMEIYLGKMSFQEIGWQMLGAIGWLLFFVLVARWEWKRGLKHYSAVGG
jgi:ABC-2 type transport system permease protein